ncbi:transglycosylase SLT domain-containing protein [Yersinia massiliensis]|uniref:peptidoglycan lytic exotransglycosylase n=3 Tax=Yersinia TaxID=629 RepID=A0A2R4NPI8_9GAMM|nr:MULTISPECIES: transglycosylase SLT domain-containing protein [Yersinia]HEC1649176.1 transglycosylase SLT domain-containing protein [Yersinia enterocolitica]ATM86078.1 lytic transglycosylase [Yersinia frederiksenii]AVX38037.1 lytic transglycosylase [Yersinia massiliensis]MCB5317430.1 transglycosylase SLT domain-containing protein [Yersinia massiliensis]MDA5548389.1 transglycosylase SLT domain-containing protein [Yersinia massiliensis]
MNPKVGCLMAILLLAGCAKQTPPPQASNGWLKKAPQSGFLNAPKSSAGSTTVAYSDVIKQAASHYGVDETLIKAIIQVESGYNPDVVSTSNAVGLMQIKASTAGRDAYRMKGRNGQPSSGELKDPVKNIDIGAAYINILQNQQLAGINDPQTLRYATIVSYANGAGAMLRTFSSDKRLAVNKINSLSPNEFYQHIQKKHPAAQAPRYLWKVDTAYRAMSE